MNTTALSLYSQSISSDYCNLLVDHFDTETRITMTLSITQVNTIHFPQTVKILQKALPGVLTSLCFNESSLPFHKEAKKTEIGHLFEHILLEYLCIEKSLIGIDSEYNGLTSWNWREDPYGTFHIVVDAGFQDKERLNSAVAKTIELFNFIIMSHTFADKQN
jgi:hypothetical protein